MIKPVNNRELLLLQAAEDGFLEMRGDMKFGKLNTVDLGERSDRLQLLIGSSFTKLCSISKASVDVDGVPSMLQLIRSFSWINGTGSFTSPCTRIKQRSFKRQTLSMPSEGRSCRLGCLRWRETCSKGERDILH